jgi:hypothetical protein
MAAVAAPAQKTPWNDDDGLDDGLADDEATFSYGRALRTNSRFEAPELSDQAFTQPLDPDVLRFCEAIPDALAPDSRIAAPQAEPAWKTDAKITPDNPTAHDLNLKSASITIRLSKAECVQLRRRAAEAELTVSAYLRSCTFEAESLRALVKDTLAQLRTINATEDQKPAATARTSRFAWLHRLRLYPQNRQLVARA